MAGVRACGLVLVVTVLVACGRDPVVAPRPTPVTPPAPVTIPTWTVSGRVVEAVSGNAVGGARLDATSIEAWTDAAGRFALNGQGVWLTVPLVVEHPGFVTRATRLAWAPSRDDATVDLISLAAPFDMTFYRQFVRDDLESPGLLRPLTRWTTAPSWYVVTTTLDSGRTLAESELQKIETHIRAAVPAFSGGLFEATVIERGTTPPTGRGWVIVRTEDKTGSHPTVSEYCGWAYVGENPGHVVIVSGCISARVVTHEVGHAMGFWHVADRSKHVMGSGDESFFTPVPSATERYHARIAYSRQPGNSHPDNDAALSLPLALVGSPQIPTACP